METAALITFAEITEGATGERDYVITPAVHEHFLRAFADHSPIHVDPARARACGFAGCVMHGGILNGFVSHFVGMVFPGVNSLLLSVELRFLQPTYLNETLRLQSKVVQKLDVQQVVVLQLTFLNLTRNLTAATGRVQVKVRDL